MFGLSTSIFHHVRFLRGQWNVLHSSQNQNVIYREAHVRMELGLYSNDITFAEQLMCKSSREER
jgi:hypothetical protein